MGNQDDFLSEDLLKVIDVISLNESQIDNLISKSLVNFFKLSHEAKIFELVKKFPNLSVLSKMKYRGAIYSELIKPNNYENEFMDFELD